MGRKGLRTLTSTVMPGCLSLRSQKEDVKEGCALYKTHFNYGNEDDG